MSDKRNQIQNIATESVQRSGLSNLSFRTLADDVGIKSASVHYHFPSKSDLAASIIETYSQAFAEELDTISDSRRNLKGKLDDFVQIFETVLENDKLCLCGMMAAEVTALDESSRTLLKQYFEMSEQWLLDLLSENKESLSTALSTKKLARIIMSGLEGAILLDRVDQGRDRISAQRDLVRSFVS